MKTQTIPGDLVLPMRSKIPFFVMIRWRIQNFGWWICDGSQVIHITWGENQPSFTKFCWGNQNISKQSPSALGMCGAFFVQVVTNSFKYSSSWNPQGISMEFSRFWKGIMLVTWDS